jgi:hypothetical protein
MDMFTTQRPPISRCLLTTQSMPAAMYSSKLFPVESRAFTAQRRTPGAAPTTPNALAVAAMVPATDNAFGVPWKLSSIGSAVES